MAATVIPALISFTELILVWRAARSAGDVLADVTAIDSVLSLSVLI